MNFSLQLKGKEIEKNQHQISIVLKRSTINRWFNRLEPTMIVVYVVEEKEAYWMWFENKTVYLTLTNDTYSIKLNRNNKLSTIDWFDIEGHIKNIFSKKHLLYSLPQLTDQNKGA